MPQLRLFNSLNRKKENFEPQNPAHVTMYACGPTVYDYAHIGNARMAVVFDLLSRVLRSQYCAVTYVSNITDVDDKIIKASKDTGQPIDEITQKYTQIYNDDMAALGCEKPDIQPLATQHMSEMVEIIDGLVESGHAYEADGHVLFHVPSFPAYGALSGRSRDEQIAGARVEVASYKKDPADFVLWKPSADDEPGWDYKFGRGRPGWHIECSAMVAAHMNLPIDIHGGGADLKFPHHENEIAQSCCSVGATDDAGAFAKTWVHNGFVTVEGEKMSKSLGNFIVLNDLLARESIDGAVIRIALLSAHYRQPLDWGQQCLHQAKSLLDRLQSVLQKLEAVEVDGSDDMHSGVLDALCDDLNTPLAFAELNGFVKQINKADSNDYTHLKAVLINTLRLLGVVVPLTQTDEVTGFEMLLSERDQAKAEKNWSRADEIRDELAAQGYKIIDMPDGAKLEKV
ncbi:MAG: cysteine--tRNA ligase [Bdellovibrionales bacterium]